MRNYIGQIQKWGERGPQTKTRERKTRCFTDIRCVKGEDQKVLIDRKDFKIR